MPIQKSEAILLRRQDLRETSVILTFYSKDFGKIKGVVRGVRGPRAQFCGGSFEIFALDSIVFYERKTNDIYTISQCDLLEFFGPVRDSLEALAHATYLVELLDSVTGLADPQEGAFDLLLGSLKLLAAGASPKRVTRIFEIKLLDLLGLMPTLAQCASCGKPTEAACRFSLRHGGLVCKACGTSDRESVPILPGTVKFIELVRTMPFEKVSRVKVTREIGRELEGLLRSFLNYHIERRLRTVDFLREVERA